MDNKDLAIMDSSLVRAREGLRVLDEIARFALNDRPIFATLKVFRHDLQSFEKILGIARLISGREGIDSGTGEVVESEYSRSSLFNLIRANASRVTESLRVLEEFAKIYSPELSPIIEDGRYRLYTTELSMLKKTPHYWLNKYFEEGIVYPISDSVEELIWLINNGAKIIQLRDKASPRAELFIKAKKLCDFVSRHNLANKEKVLFIINDSLEVAAALPVAGAHLGQEDGLTPKARQILGSNKIIGRSNQTAEQVAQSIKDGADYVAVGPIFSTPLKPNTLPVGLPSLAEIARETLTPLVAIGGIDKTNIGQIYAAGVKNVAVIRAAKALFS